MADAPTRATQGAEATAAKATTSKAAKATKATNVTKGAKPAKGTTAAPGTRVARPAVPPGHPPGTRVTKSGRIRKPTRQQRRINKMRSRPPTRFLITYDINGPKVRLGILWALLIGVATLGQETGIAALYGTVAAVGGWQAAKAWKAWGASPEEYTAGFIAGAIAMASAVGFGMVGVAILGSIPLALLSGFTSDGARRNFLGAVGVTLQCGLFLGVAAASPALTYRIDLGGFIALILFVCVYEMGDFLIGSGSSNHIEGPLAGMAGIAVFAFAMAVVHLPPFEGYEVAGFAAAAAVLCPLGQLAGSAVLPRSDARAPALRRLDSLILLGPAWTFGLYQYLSVRGR